MKNFIFILVLFFVSISFCNVYMSISDRESYRNAADIRITSYPSLAKCVQAEGEACSRTDNKNLEYEKVENGAWVEDVTLKAAYEAKEAEKAQKESDKAAAKVNVLACKALLEGSASSSEVKDCVKEIVISLGY